MGRRGPKARVLSESQLGDVERAGFYFESDTAIAALLKVDRHTLREMFTRQPEAAERKLAGQAKARKASRDRTAAIEGRQTLSPCESPAKRQSALIR